MKTIHHIFSAIVCMVALSFMMSAEAADEYEWSVFATGRTELDIEYQDEKQFKCDFQISGPKGTNPLFNNLPTVEDGRRVFSDAVTFRPKRGKFREDVKGVVLDYEYGIRKTGSNTLEIEARVASEKMLSDAKLGTWLNVPLQGMIADAKVSLVEDGKEIVVEDLTNAGFRLGQKVRELRIAASNGESIIFKSDKNIRVDNVQGRELHLFFWAYRLVPERPEVTTITMQFPDAIGFYPESKIVDTSDWYPLEIAQDFTGSSSIGMQDWLEAPAGKHGFVQCREDQFVCEDGTPIKFWGTNISYALMAPPEDAAEKWADKYAKYGVNLVRFHKFTGHKRWNGLMDPEAPMQIDAERVQLFDNMHAELRERGIYVGWSPIFSIQFHEAFRDRLIDYDELQKNSKAMGGMFANSLYPLSTFCRDVQDIYIDIVVTWLNHTNSVTGLRYADDPALAYVEFQNEADLFFGMHKTVENFPTYKKIFEGEFCQWLKKKYGDEAALKKAWGEKWSEDDNLEAGTISPFIRYTNTPKTDQRTADSYHFLYQYQLDFYTRFKEAVRKTGYRGALVGSCWRASDTYGELLNIATDRKTGFIDRHHYYRADHPMVSRPGTVLLDSGLQQVADRPFALSEWAGPHTYGVECPPVIGFIGLGVQGWDLSAQFASSWWGIRIDNNAGVNANCDVFYNIGQYPFIARTLYSGNLAEGETVLKRMVNMDALLSGRVGLPGNEDSGRGMLPEVYGQDIPESALAAGKVVLEFTDQPIENPIVKSFDQYIDTQRQTIKASNGQVFWNYEDKGYFTLQTESTEAIIGFHGGETHVLDCSSIRLEQSFGNIILTARNKGENLKTAKHILVLVLGRTADRGDLIDERQLRVLQKAELPEWKKNNNKKYDEMLDYPSTVVFEPLNADIFLKRKGSCKVFPLDHDGRQKANTPTIDVGKSEEGIRFSVDGNRDKTMYYLIDFSK